MICCGRARATAGGLAYHVLSRDAGQVRLFRKGRARYSEHFSHEKVIVNGVTETLSGAIAHHAYPDIDTWFMMMFSGGDPFPHLDTKITK